MKISITPKHEQINRNNEWEILSRCPNDYNSKSIDAIKAFCDRMVEIRKIRNDEIKNNTFADKDKRQRYSKNEKPYTQESLAKELGITAMMVSKYEYNDFIVPINENKKSKDNDSGNDDTREDSLDSPIFGANKSDNFKNKPKIKAIPFHHLRRICVYYNVTPHYILGLVKEQDGTLYLDEDGNRMTYINKEGKEENRVLTTGVFFDRMEEIDTYEKYKNLAVEHPKLYKLINKLINTTGRERDLCVGVLTAIFENN